MGRASAHRTALALGVVLLAGWPAAAPAEPGRARVEGTLRLDLGDTALADLGPVVVFLEALDPGVDPPPPPPVSIDQRNARFAPSFLAVVRGQTVEMPNRDAIFHNVFSFSRPNDFDLGTYPAGQSRSVTFEHPGVVRVYCSIHERMNATIVVTPTPWYAVAGADGRYRIEGVPAGRYRLRTWTERLPGTDHELRLAPGERRDVDVLLASSTP